MMDMNFVIALSISLLIVGGITLVVKVFKEYKNVKEVTDLVIKSMPEILDTISGIVGIVKPEYSAKLERIEDIIVKAVNAVEQVSKNTNMTSIEKKNLALEYFKQIAKDVNLPELTELQELTLSILIENAVMEMNKLEEKYIENKEKEE